MNVVDPEIAPEVAVTSVLPPPTLVTRPRLPAALLATATAGFAVDQVTEVVTLRVELSLNVPMAVS